MTEHTPSAADQQAGGTPPNPSTRQADATDAAQGTTPGPAAGLFTPLPAAERSEVQWQEILSPERYHVLREAGTERPFTGEYWDEFYAGTYLCGACGAELFDAGTKFDARCGWPSFFAPLAEDRVVYIRDTTLGMVRTEVRCAACDSHLGHVFDGEGLGTPTDRRFCMNSLSLDFRPSQDSSGAEPDRA